MLINVPQQLSSHLGSHSASISMTLQTHAGQRILNEDMDDILEKNVGNIQEATDAPIIEMQILSNLDCFHREKHLNKAPVEHLSVCRTPTSQTVQVKQDQRVCII